jgi:2-oxoisovalerate dehydrogenase E2 component (dihydrolipoyl transacylase)
MTTFNLPDLGEGLSEAEIVAWHVGVGDRVMIDQPLVSVETAKAVVEIPAPWSGRLTSIRGQPGEMVPVGSPLAEIDSDDAPRDEGTVVGTLPQTQKSAQNDQPRSATTADARVKASPAVRKRAAELGIDIGTLRATGPNQTITLSDVQTVAPTPPAADGYMPLRGVRRAMAEIMTRTGAEVVATTVTDEAIIDAWPTGTDPTLRLVRSVIAGCRAAPELNVWLDGPRKQIRIHETIDLGIAVETADGLFAPVLRDVANRTDADLRAGLDAMKHDVKARSIPLSELRGQTISLSNFGMLGGLHAALAITPPQVAIIGAGRIHEAVRLVDGKVAAARVLPLSLTFDHRAVTGAEAIRFLVAAVADLQKA